MTSVTVPGSLPLHPPADLRRRLLDVDALSARQARADRILSSEGAGHLVHDLPVRADGRSATLESRPWRIDPVPVVLDAATFEWLALAVAERMTALEAVVADLYGARRLVEERIVPAELLAATERYRIDAIGSSPRRWITTYAVDVVLDEGGMWWHVADYADAPAGLGYALLDRSVMSRVLPDLTARPDVAPLARFTDLVRRALAATSAADSPRTVLFSGGLDHPSYVDHSYLAVELGINLVEGADLVVRQRRVWLRTLDGLEPVDVLYRRIEDAFVDPLGHASRGSIGVPGLFLAQRAGGVSIANAHGSGILEEPELRDVLAVAIERLAPLTQVLPTLIDTGRDYARLPMAPERPGAELGAAPATIRLFAVHDGQRVHVLPGGTGRVMQPGDHPARPTACTAKDVWVLGRHSPPIVSTPRLPQVDFGRSVPTRAADALYWMNRSAERAEAMVRVARVVTSRIEQDPGLATLHGGAWCERMSSVVIRLGRRTIAADGPRGRERLEADLARLDDAVADEIGAVLTEASTVREFLSVTTGRVLSHLGELRTAMQGRAAGVDDFDAVLADFAALVGMWQESTVRGPAWRIGDCGRRLERCLVVLDLLDGFVGRGEASPEVEAATIEVALAASDSLVAYRRRHRSEVEAGLAIRLLVADGSNPRSLAASIDRLERHAADGEPAIGAPFVDDARAALELPTEEMIPVLRALVDDAGRRVLSRWFSTPVNPIPMTWGIG